MTATLQDADPDPAKFEAGAMSYRVSCRSSGRVSYDVTPATRPQVIVAVPRSEDNNLVIKYTVIESNAKEGYFLIDKNISYTVWSSMLNIDGSPTKWRRGPDIETWEDYQSNLDNQTYNITYEFLTEQYGRDKQIDVRVSWDKIDDLDTCFSVDNECKGKIQGDIYTKEIKPSESRSVIIRALSLSDDCKFRVHGAHGITILAYRTPSCEQLEGCVPELKGVQNLTLEATEEDDAWSVRVTWLAPDWAPTHYNVTLRANYTYIAIVPGNVTEVLFTEVVGDESYDVVVTAIEGKNTIDRSKGAKFPPRSLQEEGVPMAVIWLLASCSLTALTCAAVCWRKKFTYKKRNLYFSELDKMAVDENSEWVEDQWEVRPERLALHEVIGEGAFGVVRRGTLVPFKDVAVKMLKDFPSAEEIRSFRGEMELMKSVGVHPHIVSLVGCCSGRRPLILVEYCSRGDLLTFLRCSWDIMMTKRNAKYYNNNNKIDYRVDHMRHADSKLVVNHLYDIQGTCDSELTLLDLLSFCRQIAMGMEFLESNRVVHRDLAARNILVTENRTLKIADFGLSRDVYQENQYKQKGNGKMPVKWMALESLTHRIYTTHSDVWSFGVVMWEILSLGGAPYAAVSAARLPRLLAAGYRMPRPPNCTPELYELMQSCWAARPRSRPSFAELHAALDAALCARADHYLALAPPVHRTRARTLQLARNTLSWVRSKSYERPQATSNHYTVPPVATHLTADMKIP
ncbi:tyrosine-protein kinase receptor torso-like [Aricia agestis]|uniref:tyrosine-protein kinase receptor torso-like n=1 Tax=Aricia agestis TaxID=91739 RepID=UPI001C20B5C3|nr:tyrosine-protein kinase receptor torso-like [Aricia agestis]